MFISLPIKRLLLLVLFFLTVIGIALLALYIKKAQYRGNGGINQSPVSGTKTWKDEPVKQTSNFDNPQNLKREGVRIYNIDSQGVKSILSLQGKLTKVDYNDSIEISTADNSNSEKVKLSDIDEIMLFKINSRGHSSEIIEKNDRRIRVGIYVTFNPRRSVGSKSKLILRQD